MHQHVAHLYVTVCVCVVPDVFVISLVSSASTHYIDRDQHFSANPLPSTWNPPPDASVGMEWQQNQQEIGMIDEVMMNGMEDDTCFMMLHGYGSRI